MIAISSTFDAGSIDIIDSKQADNLILRIRPDNASEFAQWFHFRLQGAKNQPCRLRFIEMEKTAYPEGWKDYQALASYDREYWFRVPTIFDGNVMQIDITPECDSLYFAYFEPYSYERHLNLIGYAEAMLEEGQLIRLGASCDGRDMDLLQIGTPAQHKANIWIIARQHPGETMAEWFVEGLLHRLLDEEDPVARLLLEKACFYIVPNMNPDGAIRGNLRTNAKGANLNREWLNPTLEHSPEVFLVRQKMHETGVDIFLDIHGDESIPHNFVAGCEGVPSYNAAHKAKEDQFKAAWLAISPDFQDTHGYDKEAPGTANLSMATAYVGETFKCLAYTVEMPFKDTALHPMPEVGWNGERSRKFGASVLNALFSVIN
jgi:murein tripeptide amidase MpaA